MGDFTEFMVKCVAPLVIGAILLIALIAYPMQRMEVHSKIAEFKSVQVSLDNARTIKNVSPYEIAAIQQKVVDSNKWLANAQYWRQTVFSIYWPEDVDSLKPIK